MPQKLDGKMLAVYSQLNDLQKKSRLLNMPVKF